MMVLIISLLTVFMVLDCLLLILLVLMQLPKKEAGAGLAFGGSATDALFGAGSGNFLTKATKYSAIIFFVLAVAVGSLQNMHANRSVLRDELQKPVTTAPAAPVAQPGAPVTPTAPNPELRLTTPAPAESPEPAAP